MLNIKVHDVKPQNLSGIDWNEKLKLGGVF